METVSLGEGREGTSRSRWSQVVTIGPEGGEKAEGPGRGTAGTKTLGLELGTEEGLGSELRQLRPWRSGQVLQGLRGHSGLGLQPLC